MTIVLDHRSTATLLTGNVQCCALTVRCRNIGQCDKGVGSYGNLFPIALGDPELLLSG